MRGLVWGLKVDCKNTTLLQHSGMMSDTQYPPVEVAFIRMDVFWAELPKQR
jgi:hypothetical protein